MDEKEIQKTRLFGDILHSVGLHFYAIYNGHGRYDDEFFLGIGDLSEAIADFLQEYEVYSKKYSKRIVAGIIESCLDSKLFTEYGELYESPDISELISANAFEKARLLDEYLEIRDAFLDWERKNFKAQSSTSGKEEQAEEVSLPKELDIKQVRKYFAKAIDAGYMRKEGSSYKWLFGNNKGQARLGYFCNKAFTPPRPINKLEEIFGVKKLSASITNADDEAKRADVKKWRNEMNNNIFNN